LISGGLGEVQVYSDGAVSCVFVPALKQYTRKVTSDAKATVHSIVIAADGPLQHLHRCMAGA